MLIHLLIAETTLNVIMDIIVFFYEGQELQEEEQEKWKVGIGNEGQGKKGMEENRTARRHNIHPVFR